MFWFHYRLVDRELEERKAAESHLRELSVRLMKVQDEESRRFARELHDGLGQGLVAAKMVADSLAMQSPSDEKLSELMALLDDSVSATRTLSYLLHPPMLDEMGFASAANWFIDGYSRRTGIRVSADISSEAENLPSYIRLSLFRILQESLTNVHRHSKSAKADVRVSVGPHEVSLMVKDYGRGIPAEKLDQFNKDGASVGVGLAGMKERVAEMKGKLVVESDGSGTLIAATIPLIADLEISVSGEANA
jgi:signal transduction histidine kinase